MDEIARIGSLRFSIGHGPAGLEREAYFAGWLVVGDWLAHGMTFSKSLVSLKRRCLNGLRQRSMLSWLHRSVNSTLASQVAH
jgi:hypothetical protein